jgi:hypothetical protein
MSKSSNSVGASQRIELLNREIAQDPNKHTLPNGKLKEASQADLVLGLDIDQFTEQLVSLLDPASSINFLIYDDGSGNVTYVDAKLETPETLANYSLTNKMNFPTAWTYAKNDGIPIARSSWRVESVPTKWITWEKGLAYVYSAENRAPVNNATLSEADFRAVDWEFPPNCNVSVVMRPGFDDQSQATSPTFDIANPPCKVA